MWQDRRGFPQLFSRQGSGQPWASQHQLLQQKLTGPDFQTAQNLLLAGLLEHAVEANVQDINKSLRDTVSHWTSAPSVFLQTLLHGTSNGCHFIKPKSKYAQVPCDSGSFKAENSVYRTIIWGKGLIHSVCQKKSHSTAAGTLGYRSRTLHECDLLNSVPQHSFDGPNSKKN